VKSNFAPFIVTFRGLLGEFHFFDYCVARALELTFAAPEKMRLSPSFLSQPFTPFSPLGES
jgi:hypothetical protein